MRDCRKYPIAEWTDEELVCEYRGLDWAIYGIRVYGELDKMLYLTIALEMIRRGIDILHLPHVINRISASQTDDLERTNT